MHEEEEGSIDNKELVFSSDDEDNDQFEVADFESEKHPIDDEDCTPTFLEYEETGIGVYSEKSPTPPGLKAPRQQHQDAAETPPASPQADRTQQRVNKPKKANKKKKKKRVVGKTSVEEAQSCSDGDREALAPLLKAKVKQRKKEQDKRASSPASSNTTTTMPVTTRNTLRGSDDEKENEDAATAPRVEGTPKLPSKSKNSPSEVSNVSSIDLKSESELFRISIQCS